MWGQHGAVLCIVGCLEAFLAYIHLVPINTPWIMTENVSRHYQMSPGSREKAKLGLVENHCLNPTLQGGAWSDQQGAVWLLQPQESLGAVKSRAGDHLS